MEKRTNKKKICHNLTNTTNTKLSIRHEESNIVWICKFYYYSKSRLRKMEVSPRALVLSFLLLLSHKSRASFVVGVDADDNVVMSVSEGKNVSIVAGAGGSIVLNSVDVLEQQALLAQQFNVMNQSLAQMQMLVSFLNNSNFNLQSQVTSLQSMISLQNRTIVDQELTIVSLNKAIQALMPSSCAAILRADVSAVSGVYSIFNRFGLSSVWCEMMDGVAWTLVLKVNGNLSTFYYESPLWNNSATLNEPIIDGHDNTEYKSTMYSIMPFTQLLLGMRDPSAPFNTTRWVPMDYTAISLLDVLIRPGTTVTPTPNRTQALYLGGPGTQLQANCNLAGFNLIPVSSPTDVKFAPTTFHVRIGFFANEQNDCGSPDSFVGFGGSYERSGFDTACGRYKPSFPSFGYILAR